MKKFLLIILFLIYTSILHSLELKKGWNLVGFKSNINLTSQILDIPIINSEINATYSYTQDGIIIEWSNDTNSSYSLTLYNGDQQLYYGGHGTESAGVNFNNFSLTGNETLVGSFSKYASDGSFIESYDQFKVNLKRIDSFFNGDIKLAWKFINNKWEIFSSDSNIKSQLNGIKYKHFDGIEKSEGIWLYVDNNITISEDLNQEASTINTYNGWNLVSSPNTFSIDPSLLTQSKLIWKYKNNKWYAYSKEYNITEYGYDTIDVISSDEGFWVLNQSSIAYTIGENNVTLTRVQNRTAPISSPEHLWLTGDFTDSDGDGMTDVAENKYGFDPSDANSFPTEPPLVEIQPITVDNSEINAAIEVLPSGINIRWENTETTNFSLTLDNGDQQLYYGGHYSNYAEVNYGYFSLDGNETLIGHFTEYSNDTGQVVSTKSQFTIDLNTIDITPTVGEANNTISYSFDGFDSDDEALYRDFLKKVWPIMYERLGPPAETFNCVITNMGSNSDYFMIVDNGRKFLTDTSFIPRLIVHEFIHAWKGSYAITNDENWQYDNKLSGFEEATAEGMAFEIMHEFVRTYPTDYATQALFAYRPHQYQSRYTNHLDTIRFQRWTEAGDFWTHTGSMSYRYATASVTYQTILKEYPSFYKDTMQSIFDAINNDSSWRPTRDKIMNIWKSHAPTVQAIPLDTYLNAMPVFNGKKLNEGVYILNNTRHYGNMGNQQYAVTYVNDKGETWWNTKADDIRDETKWNVPSWLNWIEGPNGWAYQDIINQPFTINVQDMMGNTLNTYHKTNIGDYDDNGIPDGFGWTHPSELNMQQWNIGLYKQNVTFDNFITYNNGANEDFYSFGYKNYAYQKDDFVVMIGADIPQTLESTITINNVDYNSSVENGVAVFNIPWLPLDYEGIFDIKLKANSSECKYQRTLLESTTYHGFKQYGFIIKDQNFNCIEDWYE